MQRAFVVVVLLLGRRRWRIASCESARSCTTKAASSTTTAAKSSPATSKPTSPSSPAVCASFASRTIRSTSLRIPTLIAIVLGVLQMFCLCTEFLLCNLLSRALSTPVLLRRKFLDI
jgi:hypothetical protein